MRVGNVPCCRQKRSIAAENDQHFNEGGDIRLIVPLPADGSCGVKVNKDFFAATLEPGCQLFDYFVRCGCILCNNADIIHFDLIDEGTYLYGQSMKNRNSDAGCTYTRFLSGA
jgi:hypothetical protein